MRLRSLFVLVLVAGVLIWLFKDVRFKAATINGGASGYSDSSWILEGATFGVSWTKLTWTASWKGPTRVIGHSNGVVVYRKYAGGRGVDQVVWISLCALRGCNR